MVSAARCPRPLMAPLWHAHRHTFVVFVVIVFVAPQPLCPPVDPIVAPILAPPLSGRRYCRSACFALVVWHKAACKIG